MNGASADSERGFLDRFGQGRVTVTGARNVLGRCTELHGHDDLVDQVAGIRSDDVGPENPVGLRIRQNFHETVGIRIGPST